VAQLYSNENFPKPVVDELRQLGHDVLTVFEAGNAEQSIPDEEVMAFAIQKGRAVLTLNRKDFIRLHRQTPTHCGVIACTYDPNFVAQAQRIDAAIKESPALAGQLLRVNLPAS
jgi:predicted nuclease of predicted toxin-antitoxin system